MGESESLATVIEVMTDAPITVTFGGKEFKVKPLPMGRDIRFRQRLSEALQAVVETTEGIRSELARSNGEDSEDITDIDVQDYLSELLPLALSQSFDAFIDLVFCYPELAQHREWILDHSDEEEFIREGGKVIRLAGGRIKKLVANLEPLFETLTVGML